MEMVNQDYAAHGGVAILILLHLTIPVSSNSIQKGTFPCEKFDHFHAPQEFLKEFCPLIRPLHSLSPKLE